MRHPAIASAIRPVTTEVQAIIAGRTKATALAQTSSTDIDAKLFVDPAMVGQRPSSLFEGKGIEPLGGLKDHWFDKLTPTKDAVVRHVMAGIAANTKMLELETNGGNNAEWFKLITTLATSGAPQAEDYFVEFASKVEGADPAETLRASFSAARGRRTGALRLARSCTTRRRPAWI